MLEHVHVTGEAHGKRGVLFDRHDREAAVAQLLQFGEQLAYHDRCKAKADFVDEKDVGP